MSAWDHRMLVVALALTALALLIVAVTPSGGRATVSVWMERRTAGWLAVAGVVATVAILLTAPVRA